MNLILEREIFTPNFTLGTLYGMGKIIAYTCEDTVRGDGNSATVKKWKIPSISAIPYGKYHVVVDFSQRFKKHLPHLLDVPGFLGVRFHGGNVAENSEGCPLLGITRTKDGVKNCAPAVAEVMRIIEEANARNEKCWVTITKAENH